MVMEQEPPLCEVYQTGTVWCPVVPNPIQA